MLNLANYQLFYEHLYDYPGNLTGFLEILSHQLTVIAGDVNLAKMEVEINLPQLFCDRFPFHYQETVFDSKHETDTIPVYTEFTTDHDGLISVTAFATKGTHWTREQTKEMIFLNEQIIVLITRSRLQTQLKKAEETDNVTSVLNLTGVIHVGELLSIKKMLPKYSVLSLNINNFSTYNTKYGHVNGDILLKNYATGLSDFIGKNGVIGRTGSDNFIVIINTSKIQNLIDFLHHYKIEIELEDMETESIGFSTRIGICDGTQTSHFRQLLVNARQAMKQTKPAEGVLFVKFHS